MHLIKVMIPVLTTGFLIAGSAESIYQSKCASCHGKKAEKKALGHSNIIKGMSIETFITRTEAFATGKEKAMPIAKIVKKKFIDTYSKEEIKAVAEYVHTL